MCWQMTLTLLSFAEILEVFKLILSRIASNILNIYFSVWQALSRKNNFHPANVERLTASSSAFDRLFEAQTAQILANIFVISLPALLVGKKAPGIPHSVWGILNNSKTLSTTLWPSVHRAKETGFSPSRGLMPFNISYDQRVADWFWGLRSDHVLVITWKLWPGGFELTQQP